ncbi:sugar transferase [Oceanirhabdus sp. W0125-5]|uniref:sugar transferase n=1 Tax=Oceanirhabdus sp. W0125-5 TaxID=2999116 RepID=UPI0022F2E2AE|nr:sugar transferase [Oceanirhabdus sp. W0125-5]WBW98945.1 sugar transferase [Oceanirhabdus sp. W0125-5]
MKIIKRMVDIVLSIVASIFLFPVFIVVSVLVYFKLGSPIFFVQERVGKNGKVFNMIKYRTMLNTKNKNGELLSDEKRLTKFGKGLRNTSLDELPELINVIKGDMSLVGPRPLLVDYLSLYNERQMKRHDVKPGITGWAQINGRNSISWDKKFKLDVWYVENWSFLLDFKIIFITINKVLKKHGINQVDNVTMERFNGFN